MREKALAAPSGLGFRLTERSDSVYAFWGAAQVAQLRAHQAGVTWVYAVRPAEFTALAEAWDSAGGKAVRHGLGGGADLLELRDALPSRDPEW